MINMPFPLPTPQKLVGAYLNKKFKIEKILDCLVSQKAVKEKRKQNEFGSGAMLRKGAVLL